MNTNTNVNTELLTTFKFLLRTENYGSQAALSNALSNHGFKNISQAKISRLLRKVGAIKVRNYQCNSVYRLVEKQRVPCIQQPIETMIIDVKHNGAQIIVKTVSGAASLISRIIEDMGENYGVLGCMASANMVLVLPTDVNDIEKTTISIIAHIGVKTIAHV